MPPRIAEGKTEVAGLEKEAFAADREERGVRETGTGDSALGMFS